MSEQQPLNEFTREEWFDVVRTLKPDLSEEQFEELWDDFQQMKQRKKLQ